MSSSELKAPNSVNGKVIEKQICALVAGLGLVEITKRESVDPKDLDTNIVQYSRLGVEIDAANVTEYDCKNPVNDGSTAALAFQSLGELDVVKEVGRKWFDFGNGPFQASVELHEGRYRMLILQYHHQGGTNPALAPGVLPVASNAALGTDNGTTPTTAWGHISDSVLGTIPDAETLVWYGITSAHNRVIHFEAAEFGDTSLGDGDWRDIGDQPTLFNDHSAVLPGGNLSGNLGAGDTALTNFPIYIGGANHWAMAGQGARWEVDDFPGNEDNDTIHKMWITGKACTCCGGSDSANSDAPVMATTNREFAQVTNGNDGGAGKLSVAAVLVVPAGEGIDASTFGTVDGVTVPVGYSYSHDSEDQARLGDNVALTASGGAYWVVTRRTF